MSYAEISDEPPLGQEQEKKMIQSSRRLRRKNGGSFDYN